MSKHQATLVLGETGSDPTSCVTMDGAKLPCRGVVVSSTVGEATRLQLDLIGIDIEAVQLRDVAHVDIGLSRYDEEALVWLAERITEALEQRAAV